MNIQCSIYQCNQPPKANYTWGGFAAGSQHNSCPLCEQHARELWDKIRPQVTAGLCFYSIDEIKP